MRILLIDDDPTISRIASMSLTRRGGHQVVCASGGEEGILAALREPPELILLDINMPEIDGFETCRRLKERAETAGIPVIFLSAQSDDEERRRAKALGAVGILPKPFDPLTLSDSIRALLGQAP